MILLRGCEGVKLREHRIRTPVGRVGLGRLSISRLQLAPTSGIARSICLRRRWIRVPEYTQQRHVKHQHKGSGCQNQDQFQCVRRTIFCQDMQELHHAIRCEAETSASECRLQPQIGASLSHAAG